jgi:phosphatidylglycerol:prolipoprotein diacylglycerol transferase
MTHNLEFISLNSEPRTPNSELLNMYPILFQFGRFHIYAYGFFIVVGFAAATVLAVLKIRKSNIKISFENATELFFYTVLSAYLGSRILYVLINFDGFRQHPLQIFKIWEGGLVFYGGLFPAAVVAFCYMRRHGLPLWKLADLISPLIALGLSSGRIGCFLAGCCYGKETSLPWAVVFRNPDSLARLNVPLHPTQLYDAANGLALFFFLSWMEKRKAFDGQIFWLFLLFYSMTRFFIEIFRGDPRGFLFGDLLSTSQAIGILLAIFSLFMLFYRKKRVQR